MDFLFNWFEMTYARMIGYAASKLDCCPDSSKDCVHDYWLHARKSVFLNFDPSFGIPLDAYLWKSFKTHVWQWTFKNCGDGAKGAVYKGKLPNNPDDPNPDATGEVVDESESVENEVDVKMVREAIFEHLSPEEKRLFHLKHECELSDLEIARILGVKAAHDENLDEIANELLGIPRTDRVRARKLVEIAAALKRAGMGAIAGEKAADFRQRIADGLASHPELDAKLNEHEENQIRARIANRLRLMHERLDVRLRRDKRTPEFRDVFRAARDRAGATGQIIPDAKHVSRLKKLLKDARKELSAHNDQLDRVSATVAKLLGENETEEKPSALRAEAVEILIQIIENCPPAETTITAIISLIHKAGPAEPEQDQN